MRITWVVDGFRGDDFAGWRSDLASHRYRVLLPAKGLQRLGHEVGVIAADEWSALETFGRADVVVIGKLLAHRKEPQRFRDIAAGIRRQASRLIASGVPVVADFNDDHFDDALHGEHWRELALRVTACIAGSQGMAAILSRRSTVPVHVVGDPIASPGGDAHFERLPPKATGLRKWLQTHRLRPMQLLWYGNLGNWPALTRWAETLAPLGHEIPFMLTVVTKARNDVHRYANRFNEIQRGPSRLRFVEWSEQRQWHELGSCDLVLVPSDPDDPTKQLKTANRVTDALNAGRMVIASDLPAYRPYADGVMLGEDPVSALRQVVADPSLALDRIRRGQREARLRCALPVIAARWAEALGDIVKGTTRTPVQAGLTLPARL